MLGGSCCDAEVQPGGGQLWLALASSVRVLPLPDLGGASAYPTLGFNRIEETKMYVAQRPGHDPNNMARIDGTF